MGMVAGPELASDNRSRQGTMGIQAILGGAQPISSRTLVKTPRLVNTRPVDIALAIAALPQDS